MLNREPDISTLVETGHFNFGFTYKNFTALTKPFSSGIFSQIKQPFNLVRETEKGK